MQSPLLKSKDRTHTHLVYLLVVLYYEQPVMSETPAFQAERTTTVNTIQAIGMGNLRSDTNKGHPIQNLLSY